jgi:hypothetical protein
MEPARAGAPQFAALASSLEPPSHPSRSCAREDRREGPTCQGEKQGRQRARATEQDRRRSPWERLSRRRQYQEHRGSRVRGCHDAAFAARSPAICVASSGPICGVSGRARLSRRISVGDGVRAGAGDGTAGVGAASGATTGAAPGGGPLPPPPRMPRTVSRSGIAIPQTAYWRSRISSAAPTDRPSPGLPGSFAHWQKTVSLSERRGDARDTHLARHWH